MPPWHVERTDQCPASRPWGVILKADGTVVEGGCHTDHARANRHLAALYAREPRSAMRAELLARASPFLLPQFQLREQPRDAHGRFDFGEGHPDTAGGGVRQSLKDAKTTDEIAAVTRSELNSITGRDHGQDRVIFHGDPDIAREHAEGILRAQAEHPDVVIAGVRTFDPENPGAVYYASGDKDAMAMTSTYRNAITGRTESVIRFNDNFTNNTARYQRALDNSREQGWLANPTPGGVATHEFGHAWASQAKANTAGRQAAVDHARSKGVKVTAAVREGVSAYATTSAHELAAESFAQVLAKGGGASSIARVVYDAVNSKRGGR